MKFLILLPALLLWTFSINAQEDKQVKAFLEDFFEENSEKLISFYCERMDNLPLEDMLSAVKANKVVYQVSFSPARQVTDSIGIGAKELDYIAAQLTSTAKYIWRGELRNAKLISRDSILSIIKSPNKGESFFYKNYGGFYSFSKPVFIKRGKVALCYFEENFGSGAFGVFRKVDGRWKLFSTYFVWVS